MKSIKSEAEYKKIMSAILELMNRGETNQTRADKVLLRSMASAAQEYEKKCFVISPPKTIEGMIELKMYEKELKQKDLAKIMGLAEAKLSQILNGKRRPDVSFLKAAHQKPGIDASFLLVYA
jgi:HTH-type transcriptional regulator / antitoxin HigA